ncbi:MAG: hypothetical protein WBD50_07380 [Candidatus Rhabdochlamydia sp.]
MTIQNIKDFSIGFGISSALISNWATLSEYKAGKIHLFHETLDRYAVVDNSLTFTKIVLEKLTYIRVVDQLQSKPIKWAIRLTPIALGYLKGQAQKNYPLLAKSLTYLESCVEKAAYVTFIIGSIALVHFGHLSTGYSALSTLIFNQIISSGFAKSHLPLLNKVDSVFKLYANPIAGLVGVVIGGSYLTIGYTLFSFTLMAHASLTKPTYIIQKSRINTEGSSSNQLTLEKWEEFNTEQNQTFLTVNRERIPNISFPQMDENMDAKQSILDILKDLPENLQTNLISRMNALPKQPKIQTFEEAKLEAITYLDKLISFTKQRSDPIWNALLQQSCLLLQQLNSSPDKQLSGIKELLFGNEGQCEVAQQRNLISGFLKLSEADQLLIDALELRFNFSLEALLSENFHFFLQAGIEEGFLTLEKTKVRPLISSLRNFIDLTDMHTYQRYEKFYGPHFGIKPFAKDLVAEASSVDLMSSPFLYISMKYLFKLNTKDSSNTYFITQLQKITPWLRNQIALGQSFNPSDINSWFMNWVNNQNLSEEEKDTLINEFTEYGTIAGYQVCNMDSGDIEPIALIAFLYGMNVFTDSTTTIDEQEASIQELIKSLEPGFDTKVKDFEKDLNGLDAIGIKNPSLAKLCLVDYLFSSKKSLQEKKNQFMDSLKFSEQCNISVKTQGLVTDFWRDEATELKEKFDKLDFTTGTALGKHLYNLINLKKLNLSSEILFV